MSAGRYLLTANFEGVAGTLTERFETPQLAAQAFADHVGRSHGLIRIEVIDLNEPVHSERLWFFERPR